jgi:PHD/YefM family antitoxin component YafN of YafNO toxin-antitoxin module
MKPSEVETELAKIQNMLDLFRDEWNRLMLQEKWRPRSDEDVRAELMETKSKLKFQRAVSERLQAENRRLVDQLRSTGIQLTLEQSLRSQASKELDEVRDQLKNLQESLQVDRDWQDCEAGICKGTCERCAW